MTSMSRAFPWMICVAVCFAQGPTPTQQNPELAKFLGQRMPPVDQAIGHPDLVRFRSSLIAAAARHDLTYFLSVIEPGIGGCGWAGTDGFRAFAGDAGGWAGIQRALELGGIMPSRARFRSNYVMTTFPEDADMTSYLVATKPSAAVHEKAELTSVVVSRLDYQIVVPIGEGAEWQKVEYLPGRVGYVLSDDLDRPTGYSIDLVLRKGKWRIQWIANYCD